MLTVLIIAAALFAALWLSLLAATLAALRSAPPRDLQGGALAGTRFEKYLPRVREEAAGLAALPWEDAYITSYDNLRLHARLLRGGQDAVVLLHGYRSCAENDFAGIAQWYASRGYTLLAADQRAHGRSAGRRLYLGARERRDAVAWAQYALCALDAERVWVHGVSMGAASALYALGEGYPDGVRGVIADCPYNSLAGLFAFRLGRAAGRAAGPLCALGRTLVWPLVFGRDFVRTSCAREAAASGTPVLLIAAGEDATVPPEAAPELRRALGARCEYLALPHAQHALCWQADREAYAAALERFLASTRGG